MFISCLGLLACMSFYLTTQYIRNVDIIDDKLTDLKLVTASDYTITGQISQSLYESFKKHPEYDSTSKRPINEINRILAQNIERTVGESCNKDKCKIADLQFAFDNDKMLNLLWKRAHALKKSNFKKVTKYETKLSKEKQENYEKIVRPTHFYCTFKHSSAVVKSLELGEFAIGEFIVPIKRAQEPTTVIWENKSYQRKKCYILAFVLTIAMLYNFL